MKPWHAKLHMKSPFCSLKMHENYYSKMKNENDEIHFTN